MGALIRVTREVPARDPGGRGTPEPIWEQAGLETIVPVHAEDLVPPGTRLVVVAPHPDDEALGAGGLVATLAALGRAPLIVGVTNGEASHPGSTRFSPTQLGHARAAESLEGLRALGIPLPRREALGLPDGRVAEHERALDRTLRGLLRDSDVVFTTFALDGHPDHEAAARATACACRAVGAARWEIPIWAWHWGSPRDARVPLHRAVRLPLDPDAIAAKRAAIAAHRSQLEGDPTSGRGPVVAPADRAHFERPFEIYFRPEDPA